MGCICGRSGRVTDTNGPLNGSDVQTLEDPEKLISFFSESDDEKQKCIFVFGGAGSSKGEFIWDLMRKHNESNCEDFALAYVDIDQLIASNIKQRIMDVVRQSNNFVREENAEQAVGKSTSSPAQDAASVAESLSQTDLKVESAKSFLSEFFNVVTASWVFKLINEEMCRQSRESPHAKTIFLVSLIPNRISLFKKCLYLNQTPNMHQHPFDFIALNLIKGDCQRKNLDLVSESSFSDDVNVMFVRYFRSINKLVDVVTQIDPSRKKLKVRVTSNQFDSSYRKVSSQSELTQILRCHHFSHTLWINISDLPAHAIDARKNLPLVFIVENKIEVDRQTVIELDSAVNDISKIRTLILFLRNSRRAVELERKNQRLQGLCSPRSPASFKSSSDK